MLTGARSSVEAPGPDSELKILLDQFRAGSEEAAYALYEKYSAMLLRVIRGRYLPPRSPLARDFDSDDLLQETWRSLFEQLDRGRDFPSEARFVLFLLAVLRNRFHEHIRAQAAMKRSHHCEERAPQALHAAPDCKPGPFERATAADEWRHFLARLDAETQFVLVGLRNGESISELAQQLGVSSRTVQRVVRNVQLLNTSKSLNRA